MWVSPMQLTKDAWIDIWTVAIIMSTDYLVLMIRAFTRKRIERIERSLIILEKWDDHTRPSEIPEQVWFYTDWTCKLPQFVRRYGGIWYVQPGSVNFDLHLQQPAQKRLLVMLPSWMSFQCKILYFKFNSIRSNFEIHSKTYFPLSFCLGVVHCYLLCWYILSF